MEAMSSGTSSDEENGELHVGNLSLEVVEQGWSGMLIDGFLEDWELARVAAGTGSPLSGDARRLVVCLTCRQDRAVTVAAFR